MSARSACSTLAPVGADGCSGPCARDRARVAPRRTCDVDRDIDRHALAERARDGIAIEIEDRARTRQARADQARGRSVVAQSTGERDVEPLDLRARELR